LFCIWLNLMTASDSNDLSTTPLDGLHRDLGARMVPFAGYAMPVQYKSIIAEHSHTRNTSSLFDVSHMGQAILHGDNPLAEFEKIVPADLQELSDGQQRYTMLTNNNGGILDDLMVSRDGDTLRIVVNAACKIDDFDYIEKTIGGTCELEILHDHALLALQGPEAVNALLKTSLDLRSMPFMTVQKTRSTVFHVSSAVPDTQVRTVLKYPSRQKRPNNLLLRYLIYLMSCRRGWGREILCAWKRAYACTATILIKQRRR
jgi:glycine cleavage system aminomethyltransferase T